MGEEKAMPTTVAQVKRYVGPIALADSGLTDTDITNIITDQGGILALCVSEILRLAAKQVMLKEADQWRLRYRDPGFTGGISQIDKDSRNTDDDRVPNRFFLDITSNPLATTVSSSSKDISDETGGNSPT